MPATLYDIAKPVIPAKRQSLVHKFMAMIKLSRQHRTLSLLDESQLRDVGISKSQANQDSRRLAWDAPHHWYK